MERKTVDFAELKVDAASGEFEGYASVFGNLDAGGDIIERGAFKKAIPAFLRDGFFSWSHDWAEPIGMPRQAREDDHGLWIAGEFHSTPEGQRARTIAYERRRAGKRTGLSIGYGVEDQEISSDGIRHLKTINPLYEVGFVMVPMNREANLAAVKAAKAAITPHSTSTYGGAWDGPANEARLPSSRAALRAAHAWADPDGDPETKATYKFIHHTVSENGDVGAASTTAASAGIAVLNGGRGGADIPDADREGVWRHLAGHLRDADLEPPELRGVMPDAGISLAESVARFLGDGEALSARLSQMAALRQKEGRVLSAANRRRLAELRDSIEQILADTDPDKSFDAVAALLEEAVFLGVDVPRIPQGAVS